MLGVICTSLIWAKTREFSGNVLLRSSHRLNWLVDKVAFIQVYLDFRLSSILGSLRCHKHVFWPDLRYRVFMYKLDFFHLDNLIRIKSLVAYKLGCENLNFLLGLLDLSCLNISYRLVQIICFFSFARVCTRFNSLSQFIVRFRLVFITLFCKTQIRFGFNKFLWCLTCIRVSIYRKWGHRCPSLHRWLLYDCLRDDRWYLLFNCEFEIWRKLMCMKLLFLFFIQTMLLNLMGFKSLELLFIDKPTKDNNCEN